MNIPLHHLDAFTGEPFRGNPAAVCRLDEPLSEHAMRAIAAENNLPATAFVWPERADFGLRWFSPAAELALCGHATLATGYVLLNLLNQPLDRVAFNTSAGRLGVERDGERLAIDLPALSLLREVPHDGITPVLGVRPLELWEAEGRRCMAVFAEAAQVRELRPNLEAMRAFPYSVIVTAPGVAGDCDFVSRYFAPSFGIAEDFVTGSAHCVLTPYWARVLEKSQLFARQLSSRGGELWVENRGERVRVAGTCVPLLEGTLRLPQL